MHLEYNLYDADPPTENKLLSGNHFEGDILGVSLYSVGGLEDADNMDLRNAVSNAWEKWPGGSIPYVISGYFGRQERGIIYRAMREFGELSCVSWRPRQSGEKDYVHIVKGEGCHSRVGKTGGAQSLSLGNEALSSQGWVNSSPGPVAARTDGRLITQPLPFILCDLPRFLRFFVLFFF